MVSDLSDAFSIPDVLEVAYRQLLRSHGVSPYIHDVPGVWPIEELKLEPQEQLVRRFMNHPYRKFEDVGRDGREVLLSRMAFVEVQPHPFAGIDIPQLSGRLRHQAGQLEKLIVSHRPPLPSVYCDLYPTGRFNAQACPVTGGALVLINMGAMQLLYSIAKINAAASWYGKSEPLIDDTQAAIAVCEVMNAYVFANNPRLARQLPLLDENRRGIAEYLTQIAEGFMMAHEYGHVLGGHLENDDRQILTISTPTGKSLEVLAAQREQEFEADGIAIDLIRPALAFDDDASPRAQAMAFGGVALFYRVALLVEEFREAAGLDTSTVTHPDTDDRLGKVLAYLAELQTSDIAFDHAVAFQEWLAGLNVTMNKLWLDVAVYRKEHPGGSYIVDDKYVRDWFDSTS